MIVSLKKPPKIDSLAHLREQELDNDSTLIEYAKYKKNQNFPHSPHRYPSWIVKKQNVFLNVHLMNESHIKILCGMSVERFWSLCDLIGRTGIMRRCPFLSLPSLVLLWRMKLRQGASNGVLAGCFQVTDKTISSLVRKIRKRKHGRSSWFKFFSDIIL